MATLVTAAAAQGPPRARILAELDSARWQVRWRAAKVLDRDATLLRDAAVQQAIAAAYLRSFPAPNGLDETGDWQAYKGAITGAVLRMKRCCNPALGAKALVEGADYDPEELHGRELAADPAAYPALFAAASRPPRRDGRPDLARGNALVVLAIARAFSLGWPVSDGSPYQLFRNRSVRLTPEQRTRVAQLVTIAATNPQDPNRSLALNALGILGTAEAKRYLTSLRTVGSSGLDRWFATKGISFPGYEDPCAWILAHPEAYGWAIEVASSAASESEHAAALLAMIYTLAEGRAAPTPIGREWAYQINRAPPAGLRTVCVLPPPRLQAAQLARARSLVLADVAASPNHYESYQHLGVLGDAGAREVLAKAAAGPNKRDSFAAMFGLRLWALTNRQPLPVFQVPR